MRMSSPKPIITNDLHAYYSVREMDDYISSLKTEQQVACMRTAVYLCGKRKFIEAQAMFQEVLDGLEEKKSNA